jgi:threonine synthase
MVKAWQEDSPVIQERHIFHRPAGIARAILRGNPTRTYPFIYPIVKRFGGEFVVVTQEEILAAQKMLWNLEGIAACANSACTLAALKKLLENGQIGKGEVVLANLTGRERDDSHFPYMPTNIITWKESQWRQKHSPAEN